MQCSSCGHIGAAGGRFCERCGAPLAQPDEQRHMPPVQPVPLQGAPFAQPDVPPAPAPGHEARAPRKKANALAIVLGVLCALLAAALVLTLLGITDAVFSANRAFSEPEDAVRYFLDRVRAGDLDGALKACAVEEAAQGYDYEAAISRLGMMGANMPGYMPSEYGLYASYNESYVRERILDGVRMMALSSTLPDEYADYLRYAPVTESGGIDFSDVVKDMDPEAFLGMEIVEISADGRDDEAYDDHLEEMAAIYGADEMAMRDVLFKIDGGYYAGGFTLLRYGKSWLLVQVGDPAINQPATGALIPLDSKSDFKALLNSGEAKPDAEETTAPAETTAAVKALPDLRIGLSMTGDYSTWSALLADDLTDAASARGAGLSTYFADWDLATQAKQIQDMIALGCDAIIVWTYDAESCADALREAEEAGMYVIMLIASEPIEADGARSAFVGFDKYRSGTMLTDWMYANLNGRLVIGELTSGADSTATEDLSGALADAAAYAGWYVVETVNAGYATEDAYLSAMNMLTAYPDVNVLFCHSDALALGAAEAVAELGLTGKVSVVCMAESQAAINSIVEGHISVAVMNDLHMGGAVMDLLSSLAQGRPVQARTYLDPLLVDGTNASSLSGYSY